MDRLPITRTHRKATLAVGLGLFFEFYEVFLTGVLSAVLIEHFHLTKAELPPLLASTFVGMFLGALFLGRLADRFGRRGAFLLNLSIYSVFSFVGAFSTGPVMLLITRFVAGIGLGAEPPLADTYLTDVLPKRSRGRFIAWAYTLAFLGVPVVGFLAKGLTEHEILGVAGWRWMFIFGALGAAIVFAMRRGLPESPRWLETVGRTEEAERVVTGIEEEARADGHHLAEPERTAFVPEAGRLRTLFGREYGRRTWMMTIFHLFQTMGYYGFGTLVPLVLAAKGYAVSQSLLFTALTFIGYPVGSALSLPIVERVERKFLVIGSVLGMGMFGLAFGYANSMVLVLVFGFLYTAVSNIFSNSFHIYQAEIFPTRMRATAVGSAYSLSRLSGAILPFITVSVLDHLGASTVFVGSFALMVLLCVDVGVLGPRSTGLNLEDASGEARGGRRASGPAGAAPPARERAAGVR
jgi:putative MFS transporter